MTKPISLFVKLPLNKLDDMRFMRLSPALLGRWTQLILLAGKCDSGGAFIQHGRQMSIDDIALYLRSTPDAIKSDFDNLKSAGLIYLNGRGWQLSDYEDEQGPDDEIKRAYWRERQRIHREGIKRQGLGNDSQHTESESESESDKESESESDKEESNNRSSSSIHDDDDKLPDLKIILSVCGIPPKFYKKILDDKTITAETILAELARNYSRQGSAKGQVKNPGYITAMNLTNGEKPSVDWLDQSKWIRHLPDAMLLKLDLIEPNNDQEDIGISGYTNGEEEPTLTAPVMPIDDPKIEHRWQSVLGQLKMDMPKAAFDTWVRDTKAIGSENGVVTILARNQYAVDWLSDRLKSTVDKMLSGVMDKAVNVTFISPEATP